MKLKYIKTKKGLIRILKIRDSIIFTKLNKVFYLKW